MDSHYALHRVGEFLRFAQADGCVDFVGMGDSNEVYNAQGFCTKYELAWIARGYQWWATAIMGCASTGSTVGGFYGRSSSAPITEEGVLAAGFTELAKYGEGQSENNGPAQGEELLYAFLPAGQTYGPGANSPANHLRFSADTSMPPEVRPDQHTGEYDVLAGSFGSGAGQMTLGISKGVQRVSSATFNTNGAQGVQLLSVQHGVNALGAWGTGTRLLPQFFCTGSVQAVGPCFVNLQRYRFTDVTHGLAYTPIVGVGGHRVALLKTWWDTTAPEFVEAVFSRIRAHQPQSAKRVIVRMMYGGNDWGTTSSAAFKADVLSVLASCRARLQAAGFAPGEYVFLLEGYFGRLADETNENYAFRQQLREIAVESEDVAYYSHRVEYSHLDIAANNWFEGGVGVTDAAHLEPAGYAALAGRLLDVIEAAQAPAFNPVGGSAFGLSLATMDLGAYTPVSATPFVADVRLIPDPSNADPISMRIDGDGGRVWPSDVQAELGVVDLSRLELSGTPGDRVLIIARTGRNSDRSPR